MIKGHKWFRLLLLKRNGTLVTLVHSSILMSPPGVRNNPAMSQDVSSSCHDNAFIRHNVLSKDRRSDIPTLSSKKRVSPSRKGRWLQAAFMQSLPGCISLAVVF